MKKENQYFIVGDRPIYTKVHSNGDFEVLAYDWKTGDFIRAINYLSIIFFSTRDDTEEVSKHVFDEKVSILRNHLKD